MDNKNKNNSIKELLQLPVRIYVYYFMLVLTFCYIYHHKFVQHADLYNPISPTGILAVLNFESANPIQYRVLTAFIYKLFSVVFFFLGPKPVYFIMLMVLAMLIILAFYLLLNKYFTDKNLNAWIAPVILYAACWNLIVLNGQFFHYDFTILCIAVVGTYLVINDNKIWLIPFTAIGVLNHDIISVIIAAFFIYNIADMKKLSYILFFISYLAIYIGVVLLLQYVFRNNMSDYAEKMPGAEHFIYFKAFTNLFTLDELPLHIVARDVLLNFGGLLAFTVLLMFRFTRFINIKHRLIYIFWLIPIFLVLVIFRATLIEMRNYSVIIPYVTLLFLVYFSRLKNSFLQLKPELTRGAA